MTGQALSSLTGAQRAAVLLLQIGKENATKILSRLRQDEVEEIAAEIVRLDKMPGYTAQEVLTECYTSLHSTQMGTRGGMAIAREMLEGTLGRTQANSIMDRVASTPGSLPFSFLRDADGRQLHNFLADEHPQTIALVVAHLRTDQSAAVMRGLEKKLQAEVAHRIAVMEGASPELIRCVAEGLQRRTSSALTPVPSTEVGGIQPLVDILNRADGNTEKLILEGLSELDAELAEEIRAQMFVFEDMANLEDRAIQLVLRSVETGALAKALKGASEMVTNKILKNVSTRARQGIEEEIELMGRMRMSEIEEARGAVVAVVRDLEARGEIVLRSNEEDEYVS